MTCFRSHAALEGPWQLCTGILLQQGQLKVMGKGRKGLGGGGECMRYRFRTVDGCTEVRGRRELGEGGSVSSLRATN